MGGTLATPVSQESITKFRISSWYVNAATSEPFAEVRVDYQTASDTVTSNSHFRFIGSDLIDFLTQLLTPVGSEAGMPAPKRHRRRIAKFLIDKGLITATVES
jgi:hypothetical protein